MCAWREPRERREVRQRRANRSPRTLRAGDAGADGEGAAEHRGLGEREESREHREGGEGLDATGTGDHVVGVGPEEQRGRGEEHLEDAGQAGRRAGPCGHSSRSVNGKGGTDASADAGRSAGDDHGEGVEDRDAHELPPTDTE